MSRSLHPMSSVEKLESRTLFATTPIPLELSGQYVGSYQGLLYEVDLRHPATNKISYSGDLVASGIDLKLTGTESAKSVLTGTIKDVYGKLQKFTATLKGKVLTVVEGGETSYLTKVSGTPAPPPPTLYARKGRKFSYESPSGWRTSESTQGLVIASPDGTQQVGLVGGVSLGVFGTQTIIAAEAKAGGKFLVRKGLKNGWIGTGLYEQQEADLYTFVYRGTTYASAEIVTTITNYYAGTYNYNTGSYSGETLALIEVITAPKAQFTVDSVTLGNMLSSIRTLAPAAGPKAAGPKAAAVHPYASGGFYDPGVYGDWSDTGGFDYSSDPWLYDEQVSMANSSAAFDESCANFDAYILS